MVDLTLSSAELANRRERITAFIADCVADAGATGAVIGLSGGIDSSLTAALAVEALGTDRVTAHTFPESVTSQQSRTDVAAVADHLGISCPTIEITPIVDSIIRQSPFDDVSGRTRGNASARTRAVLSYLVANEREQIVLGTGNRSEALIGYFTKYGDGAVDCHPIGNLYKSQVRQLAEAMDIPQSIIEKPPTAELWADQTDEDELGISYDILDQILALHVDGSLSRSATAEAVGCTIDAVTHVDSLVEQSAHKRTVPPSP